MRRVLLLLLLSALFALAPARGLLAAPRPPDRTADGSASGPQSAVSSL